MIYEVSHNRDLLVGPMAMFHGLTILEVNHHLGWLDGEQNFETQLRSHVACVGPPPAEPDLVERFNAISPSAAQ